MLSRGAALLRTAKLLKANTAIQNSVRNSHGAWNYRSGVHCNPPIVYYAAEGIMAFAWWWVLWHLWTEPGHITGEFEYPDASKWTNEELGIPDEE